MKSVEKEDISSILSNQGNQQKNPVLLLLWQASRAEAVDPTRNKVSTIRKKNKKCTPKYINFKL